MLVASAKKPLAGAASPRFGAALCGKRARSGLESERSGLCGAPQRLFFLQKLSQDGLRGEASFESPCCAFAATSRGCAASAAKGRLLALARSAAQQQELFDGFSRTASERCEPLFEVLSELSKALREDCGLAFPAAAAALQQLQRSAAGLSQVLQRLAARKAAGALEAQKLEGQIQNCSARAALLQQTNPQVKRPFCFFFSSLCCFFVGLFVCWILLFEGFFCFWILLFVGFFCLKDSFV
ncbi:hypothetical protein, conserved [Eimeria necatrix]|uniref:Uncharacterized protein n=1 Tax=Eimeria necatrix TaxID=51315 RepID=U6MGU5_9EIME|nr:hypothetical protein, conserved [Eimeria necatrix]CDJ63467.1 hypothetical protein, conserved [Eimeria necatrix]